MTPQTLPSASPESIPLDPALPETPVSFDFGEAVPLAQKLCTFNECPKGHQWQIVVRLASCPGCKQPVLMVKMVNCPVCNEPTAKMVMRQDHLPNGGALTAICKGQATLADVMVVEIIRGHASQEEANHKPQEMPGKV